MYFKQIPVFPGIVGFCGNQPTERCDSGEELGTLVLRERERNQGFIYKPAEFHVHYRNFVLTSKPLQG